MKFRFITLKATDQHNLEVLLNAYAQEGWYVKHIFMSLIVFEKDPNRNRRITVLVDYDKFTTRYNQTYKEEIDKQIDTLELFDYTLKAKTGPFIIFEGPNDSHFITDEALDETVSKPKRKLLFRSFVLQTLSEILIFSWIVWINGGFNLSSLVLSNIGIFYYLLVILMLSFAIIQRVRQIILAYRNYKHYTNPVPLKFTKTHHTADNFLDIVVQSLTLLWLIVLVVLIVGNPSLYSLIFLGTIVCFILAYMFVVLAFRSEDSPKKQITHYYLPAVIFIIATFWLVTLSMDPNIDPDDGLKPITDASLITVIELEGFDTMIRENTNCSFTESDSILARSVWVSCDKQDVRVLQSKRDWALPLIIKNATGSSSLQEHTITSIGSFGRTAYRSGNIILVSYGEIPEAIIDSLSNINP